MALTSIPIKMIMTIVQTNTPVNNAPCQYVAVLPLVHSIFSSLSQLNGYSSIKQLYTPVKLYISITSNAIENPIARRSGIPRKKNLVRLCRIFCSVHPLATTIQSIQSHNIRFATGYVCKRTEVRYEFMIRLCMMQYSLST